MKSVQASTPIEVSPLTVERWNDLESVFGPKGAYSGCWCMFWRLKWADFSKLTGEERKALLKEMTCRNDVPGVLAYTQEQPIGWCSIGPREHFVRLESSRTLKRLDDLPVWCVVCFFVLKAYRRQGVMTELLRGAVRYAAGQGAEVIEAYPLDMQSPQLAGKRLTGYSGYTGIASVFQQAGFVEVGRASDTQLIMRCRICGG